MANKKGIFLGLAGLGLIGGAAYAFFAGKKANGDGECPEVEADYEETEDAVEEAE